MEVLFDNEIGKGYIENGILFLKQNAVSINIENASKFLQLRIDALGNKSYPTVGDYRGLKSISKEARELYSSDKGHSGITSIALVMDPKIGVYIAKFFMKFNTPAVPSRIFTNEFAALDWVSQFKQN